jgi:hypothetical protein
VAIKSKVHEAVTLLVTETVFVAATNCYQEMLCKRKVPE